MTPEVSRCDRPRPRQAHRCDGAPCPLCNPVDVFDFVEPIRSVSTLVPRVGMQKSNASRKRRSFFVTDGRCLSLNFQFRRSACRSGPPERFDARKSTWPFFSITTGFQSAETVIGERTGFAFRLQLDPLPRRDCENQCLKGSISTELGRPRHVRFTPYSNRIADIPDWQLRANSGSGDPNAPRLFTVESECDAVAVG